MLGHLELAAHTAHLVLEQPLERLAQLEMHLFGQSTYVVVALDDLTRDVERLYAVGVYRALCEPTRICNLLCLGIEHFNEVATDNLSLRLGICDSGEIGKELLARVNAYNVEAESAIVVHDLLKLVLAQHSVVNEYAGEVAAYGFVEQNGSHRRVDSAGKSEDYPIGTNLLLQLCHRGIDERGCTPLLPRTADVYHKVLQEQRPLQRMEHLGMELHSPHSLAAVGGTFLCKGCILHVGCRCYALVALRNGGDGVAVAHPHL